MKNLISLDEKIFIAGSNGMVGSAIKRKLLRSNYGKKMNGGVILSPTREELDLLDINAVKEWFKTNQPTVTIVAAAKVGGIFANYNEPASFILENLKIQNNLIETSWLSGVKRLLFLGSSCIYPKFTKQPIEEESLMDGFLESTNEFYAIAKIAGLKLCESLRIQHNFDAISLMPTNLYGRGDNYDLKNGHVMAALIRKFIEAESNSHPQVICWGTGTPYREFLNVEDLAEAALFVLEKWDPRAKDAPLDKYGKPLTHLNVGTGEVISIDNLSKKIAKFTNYKGEIIWDKSKPDGTPKKQLNVSKIKHLGWEAKINLDHGIKKTINEFKRKNCF